MYMVSVIMCVYKEEQNILEKAIDSMLNQTYTEFEFIIVNDNPLDKELKKFLELQAISDDRIRLICNKKNMGLVKSLNNALGVCKGKYIARMDADDIACLDRLEQQVRWMQNNGTDILGTFVDYVNENGEVIVNCNKQIYTADQIERSIRHINCIYHPTWMVKKTVYEELNGYRDVSACEDYDFLLRAYKRNKKLEICNETLLYYRISEQGISHKKRFEQLALMQYLQKNFYRLDKISIERIKQYEMKINKNLRIQRGFYRANCQHEKALVMKRKRKMVRAFYYSVLAMFNSSIFLKLYFNMVLARVKIKFD